MLRKWVCSSALSPPVVSGRTLRPSVDSILCEWSPLFSAILLVRPLSIKNWYQGRQSRTQRKYTGHQASFWIKWALLSQVIPDNHINGAWHATCRNFLNYKKYLRVFLYAQFLEVGKHRSLGQQFPLYGVGTIVVSALARLSVFELLDNIIVFGVADQTSEVAQH